MNFGTACASQAIVHRVCTASFVSTVPLLEATESNGNQHKGVDRRCRQNDIVDFGIAHAQHALLRAASIASTDTLLEAKECNANWYDFVLEVGFKGFFY